MLTRETAAAYAGWFQCLADATRVRILNLLAEADRDMPVGEIVAALDVGQSTVSHHLKILQDTGFVHARRQGAATLVRVNQDCVDGFPSAAEIVMGRVATPRRRVAGGARSARGEVTVEPMRPDHWPAVAAIYAAGIATGEATFETEVPDWPAWDRAHLPGHRLVAMVGGRPAGWAALAPVSARCVYAGVAENSVYVADGHRGAGVGRALLTALIDSAERDGIWTIQTGIFPENEASLALHRACGFRVLGRRERIGRLGGRWRDVMFLERRSPRVG